jgi:hypothetical protein
MITADGHAGCSDVAVRPIVANIPKVNAVDSPESPEYPQNLHVLWPGFAISSTTTLRRRAWFRVERLPVVFTFALSFHHG